MKRFFTLSLLLIIINISVHSQCVQNIAAGISHSVAVKSDGTLWAWGFNGNGQLGDGTTDEKSTPTQIGTATDWKMVSAGGNHVLAIKTDGTLWAWGENFWGQCGNGTFGNDITTPVRIGTATNWKYVSAGRTFSFAIKTDGTLWSWGDNYDGQLGKSTTSITPTQVGTAADWKMVSAGNAHTLALKTDGSLWAWGSNIYYQLGDGTADDTNVPIRIGTATNWESVSAGYDFSLATKTDHTIWSWGANDMGQLGNGTYTEISTPAQIGTASDWKMVVAASYTTLALKTDGTVWASGWILGKFGVGTSNTKTSLTQTGMASDWSSIVAGDDHAFAFKADHTLWAWGNNTWGRLGNDTWIDESDPVLISAGTPVGDIVQKFCKIATVADLQPSGSAIKWYPTASGGSALASSTPLVSGQKYYASALRFNCESLSRLEVAVTMQPTSPPAAQTSQTLCPKSLIDDLVVTGDNLEWYASATSTTPLYTGGELVNGSHYFVSQTVNGCTSPRSEITVTLTTPAPPTGSGSQTFCLGTKLSALQATGTAIQWYQSQTHSGAITYNAILQNGLHYFATQTINGCESAQKLDVLVTLTPNNTPAPTSQDPLTGDQVFSEVSFTGVIDIQGRLWGWGWNAEGQMADGTSKHRKAPGLIHDGPWKMMAVGGTANLAIKTDGSLWAWGSNLHGVMGVGSGFPYNKRDLIRVGTENDWKDVAVSYHTTAASKTDGTLWTWGEAGTLLGDNNVTHFSRNTPQRTGAHTDWDDLSGGYHFFLGLKTNDFMSGWGTNSSGELGHGITADRSVPTYSGTENWQMVSGSYHYSVGIKNDGSLWAWGSNEHGVLGNALLTGSTTPARIGTASDWKFISAGYFHTLAVKNNGTLWAWGSNDYYQLGDGTTTSQSGPIQIGTDTDWKTVAAGASYSVAVKTDGSVWAWGANDFGQVGNGRTTAVTVPTRLHAGVQFTCSSATLADLTPVGSNIQWYEESWYAHTGVIDPLPPQTVLTDKKVYYATQTINGCESPSRLAVFVSFKDMTVQAPTGVSSQNVCEGATLAGLQATGTNIKWYANASGGSPLPPTTILTHNTHYYASQSVSGCESATRYDVTVTLDTNSTPAPTGASQQSACAGETVSDLVATGSAISWYSTATGGTPLPATTLLVTDSHYYASQTVNGCPSPARLDVTVTSSAAPTGNASQAFCTDATVGSLNVAGTDIKWYNNAVGGSPIPSSTALQNGIHYYASQNLAGCESLTRFDVTAVVNSIPSAPAGAATQSFDSGKTLADMIVIGSGLKWYATASDAGAHTNPLATTTTLQHNTIYYVTQSVNGCESTSAFAVTAQLLTADTQAPLLNIKIPVSGAVSVDPQSALQLTFNEPITFVEGSLKVFNFSTNTEIATITLTSSNIEVAGNKVTIHPDAPFPQGVKLYVKIDNTTFTDLAGNAYAGIADKTWSFSTSTIGNDASPPVIISKIPMNNSQEVDTESALIINFNEPVILIPGNIKVIYYTGGFVNLHSLELTNTNTSIVGNTVTINPGAPLPAGLKLSIWIDQGIFKDASGNFFKGITTMAEWTFSTAAGPDLTPPSIIGTTPAFGVSDVDPETVLTIQFNEYVVLNGGTISIFRDIGSQQLMNFDLTAFNTTIDKATVTITVPEDLPENEDVYIKFATNVFADTAGNAFAGITDKRWKFKTRGLVTSIEGNPLHNLLMIHDEGRQVRITTTNSDVIIRGISDVLGRDIHFYNDGSDIVFPKPSGVFIVYGEDGNERYTLKLILNE